MNIDSVNSPAPTPFSSGVHKRGEISKTAPAGEFPQDTLDVSRRQSLIQKLAALPEIRPEAVARGRNFLENRESEHKAAIDDVAQKLAAPLPELSSDF